ncbi:hypothetical protein FF38_04414 [Lucilia cuprina]|uniref:Uncharacterized protein n=1 Tax=Lucilia cuprina TaxID=7375 RepID=A0A0L0BQ28_LUCCU|nr:hypothetical protein CVS40_11343 [Lucilia cuprina]KNC22190.1 hypothetical protein FF38_04414 [Lucilia cuprina]
MAECSKCKTTIRGETGIRCMGVCNKIYHISNKCSGLDQYSANILELNNFIRFMCVDCIQYIHNVDLVLKEIQYEVQKNKQNLVDYKHEFESSLNQNENEIKQLLEAIEVRFGERIKKMEFVQKSCEKNVNEIQKIYNHVNELEKSKEDICKSFEEKNINMCNEIKHIIKQTNERNNKLSYAETIKRKTVLPDQSGPLSLIVKPKDRQGAEKTKEELN